MNYVYCVNDVSFILAASARRLYCVTGPAVPEQRSHPNP